MTTPTNDLELLVEYLDVCNTAMAANKNSFPHRQVLALSRLLFSGRNFSLLLYDKDSDLPSGCYTLRFVGNQLELVAEGKQNPTFSCKVRRDYLRTVVANRQEYIEHPERLDWDWLKSRLGFGHAERGETIPVRKLMTREIEYVPTGATVRDAATKMRDANVGALPVLDDRRPVGMLTDRDIAIRVVARGSDPDLTIADDVMTRDAVCCPLDLAAETAAGIMQEKGVRRLLVLDADRRVVGLLSLDDLATQLPTRRLAGETLAKVVSGREAGVIVR